MSIGAKPWEGGGAATVPDASETTKGKIRIATSAEATTGTDDLTAMTPLTVKERIDAALVGGVEYKGSYTGQSLVTAQKGDMYISSGNQTLGGISLTNGDHIIFNQNASDPVTGSMFDKIDNTDQVTSVNGQTGPVSLGIGDLNNVTISGGGAGGDLVEYDAVDGRWENVTKSTIDLSEFNNNLSADDFAADHTASNYTPANSNIDGHLSGIDSALASVGGNQITLIDLKTTSFTAVSNAVYEIQSSLTVTMPGSPSEGDLIGFYAQGNATPSLTVSGTIETINNVQTTSTTIEVNKRNVVWWGYDGARWQQLNDSIKVGTVALAGVLETASNAEATAASATDKALTPSNVGFINVGDLNDDSTYQPLDTGLTSIAGLTTSADKMLYTTGSDAYDVTGLTAAGRALLDDADATAQRTTLGLGTAATSDTGDFLASTAGLDDLSDVAYTAGAGIDNYVLTYDHSTTSWGAEAVPSAASASETVAGVIEIATNAEAAAGTATDKALVPSNISSVDLSQADNTTSGFISGITGESLNDLSDVSYTAGAGIDNYVLTYDHSTTSWGAEAAASGGLSAVVDDTTPQLGGALDVNGNAITSASNGNVTINPDGTGDISVGADIIPDADATHTIGDEDNRFISLYSDVNGALRFKAKNDEGAQITKGQVVYIKGIAGDGETPTVGLADSDDASKMPAFGLAFNTANNQAEIQIVFSGNLYGLNTSGFSVGDTLFVDTSAGGLTATKPTGETAQLQNIGRVIRSDNGAGVIMVGGAGRSAATPNLDNGKIFLGNASNQAVSTALSSAAVTSFNTQTGALTIGGDDLTADHTAVNYTAANANIDGHLSGIDSALALKAPLASPSLTGTPTAPTATQGDNSTQLATTAYVDTAVSAGGGGVDPTLTVLSNTTYTLSAANAPGIHIWYGASNSSTFTVTMPDIANVLSAAVSVNGDPGDTFEVYIGRGQAGDITVSAADGIDLLGDGSITYSTTQTVDSGQWVKLVGWYASGSTQRYLMDSAAQPRDAGLTSISGLTTAADKMIYTTASDTYAVTDLTSAGRALLDDADAAAQRTTLNLGTAATQDVGTGANNVVQLDGSSRLPAVDGSQLTNLPSGGTSYTYSAITAGTTTAQAWYHYSVDTSSGAVTINLPALSGLTDGDEIRVKLRDATNSVTIDANASENIDGSLTYTLDVAYQAVTLVVGSTEWEVI